MKKLQKSKKGRSRVSPLREVDLLQKKSQWFGMKVAPKFKEVMKAIVTAKQKETGMYYGISSSSVLQGLIISEAKRLKVF